MQHVHGIRCIRGKSVRVGLWSSVILCTSLTHLCVSFLLSWNESGTWVERERSCGCAELGSRWWCQWSGRLGDVLKDSCGEKWVLTLKMAPYTRAVATSKEKKQKHFALTYNNTLSYLIPRMRQTMYTQWWKLLTTTTIIHLWTTIQRTIFHCFTAVLCDLCPSPKDTYVGRFHTDILTYQRRKDGATSNINDVSFPFRFADESETILKAAECTGDIYVIKCIWFVNISVRKACIFTCCSVWRPTHQPLSRGWAGLMFLPRYQ